MRTRLVWEVSENHAQPFDARWLARSGNRVALAGISMSTKTKHFRERPRYKLRGAQLILVLSAVFVGNALAQQNANPRADSFAPDTPGQSRAVSDLRAPGPDTDGWLYLSRNGHPSETVCRVQLRLRQQESKRHTWGTHDQIYAFAHNKLPFADQFGWRNIEDIRAGVDEKAGEK
jgi:hypothetical protein